MKTNWGAVVMDLAIFGVAVWTREWYILLLCILTGGYTFRE